MKETDISIWKRKLDWIAEKGGMALLISHPDYMNFNHGRPAQEEYPVQFYEEFLQYVRTKYDEKYWHVLPKDMARYWEEKHRGSVISDISLSSVRKEKVEKQARRKLRVAMLSYSFYDIDARVARYAETLARRGDHVDVISLAHPGQPPYFMKNGVHVFQIQTRKRDEKGKIAYLARILKFFAKSSQFIQKRHRKNPYDVIHVHSVPDFEVFAAWFPKWKGAKIILDIHDIVPEFFTSKFKEGKSSILYKMLIMVEKMSTSFSDHVIISNHLWEKTLHRSVNGGKCSVFINYPDPLTFYKRPRQRTDGKFIMMYPGTLNRHQGVDIAIEAFGKIQKQVPGAEFHIYGQGDSKDFLADLVVRLCLEDRVIFHDMISKENIAEIMANADLGIVPKRDDPFGGEAFSTKTLEFMSLGVPLLVSATKIDRYYFNDSVVKFFEPENEEDLAEKMLMLAKNRQLREALAQNALEFVSDLTWDKKEKDYLNLLDSLAKAS
jgi:glycosyltransferase involved in cell wall biosynthesis